MNDTPRHALYEGRVKQLTGVVEALAARSANIGNLRGIAFLVAFGALIWGALAHGGTPSLVLGALAIGVFIWLVRVHAVLSTEEAYAQRKLAVNQRAHQRVTGHARVLPDDGADLANELANQAGSAAAAGSPVVTGDAPAPPLDERSSPPGDSPISYTWPSIDAPRLGAQRSTISLSAAGENGFVR